VDFLFLALIGVFLLLTLALVAGWRGRWSAKK